MKVLSRRQNRTLGLVNFYWDSPATVEYQFICKISPSPGSWTCNFFRKKTVALFASNFNLEKFYKFFGRTGALAILGRARVRVSRADLVLKSYPPARHPYRPTPARASPARCKKLAHRSPKVHKKTRPYTRNRVGSGAKNWHIARQKFIKKPDPTRKIA